MHHAARMGESERGGDAAGEHDTLARGEAAVRQALGEIFPVEPLHRQVALPRRRRAVRHVAHDAGMIELGQHAALALKAAAQFGALQNLERDQISADAIARAIDDAHAAGSGFGGDLEAFGDQLATAHGAIITSRNEGA